MNRRQFITVFGGAASWPLVGRAQQADRMQRIGVLMTSAADDSESQARIAAFMQGLRRDWVGAMAETCGWTRAGPRPMPMMFADTRQS